MKKLIKIGLVAISLTSSLFALDVSTGAGIKNNIGDAFVKIEHSEKVNDRQEIKSSLLLTGEKQHKLQFTGLSNFNAINEVKTGFAMGVESYKHEVTIYDKVDTAIFFGLVSEAKFDKLTSNTSLNFGMGRDGFYSVIVVTDYAVDKNFGIQTHLEYKYLKDPSEDTVTATLAVRYTF